MIEDKQKVLTSKETKELTNAGFTKDQIELKYKSNK